MNDLMKGLLLCLLTLPTGLFAQCPYPILQCEVSDPIGHPNRVSCQLQWAHSPKPATNPQREEEKKREKKKAGRQAQGGRGIK